ncbi:MAG TPA: hypothetical protein IAC59_10420 [Candidatus Fimadaptatus faecigallinarum]|uniref:Uncharacterized protein n=1 Tax=Candidatus Fimadaptatus faecigallinarum TaxID=2840814 RepID=A0A9D1LTD6_9FIRM|nr:hypothetical protein [Candidatus Fimadaptatus faecigallinarum]
MEKVVNAPVMRREKRPDAARGEAVMTIGQIIEGVTCRRFIGAARDGCDYSYMRIMKFAVLSRTDAGDKTDMPVYR